MLSPITCATPFSIQAEPASFTDKSALQTNYLDDAAFAALQECCRQNNLVYSEYGLLFDTWYAIKDGAIKNVNPSVTEEPGRHLIVYGETSSDVGEIQRKLQSLNYRENYTINTYDAALRDALDRFLEINNYKYDQYVAGGITPELQEWILTSDSLVPYVEPEVTPEPTPEPTPVPGKIEKVRNYFVEETNVLGLSMPNLVVWIVGLLVIMLIVLAAIHFFGPGSEGKVKAGGAGTTLSFAITYDGKTENYSCVVSKVLRIGRNVGSFPLNLNDTSISRRHCEIYYLNNQLMLHDYSTYGTQINGRLVHNSESKLNSGDTLQIGEHTIIITFGQKGK